jgi:hypothetical protein
MAVLRPKNEEIQKRRQGIVRSFNSDCRDYCPYHGTKAPLPHFCLSIIRQRRIFMNSIIYIIGLIVVILAILSFLGLR